MSFLPAVNYPDGIASPAGYVAIADLTGNGIPDIVTTEGFGDYRLSVYLGNGDGSFQPAVNYLAGDEPAGVRIADLRGNGIPDLVTANSLANTVSVLLGNGNGTFQRKRDYFVGARGPLDLVVADLRGNGILDIATVNEFSASVSVLLGNGDGTFQSAVTYPVGAFPLHIVAGRFGGDSDAPDLAVTNHDGGTVSVLVNHGDGTFRQHVDYQVGSQPFGIALGDFAQTGNLDIAVANFQSRSVSILMGNGDHTFQGARNIAVPGQPNGLVAADFNNDGNLDLAAIFEGSGGSPVGVLLGDGTGNFAPPLSFTTDLSPLGIAAANLTNDGFTDLVTANTVGRSASVLLNDSVWDTAAHGGSTSVEPILRSAAHPALVMALLPLGSRPENTFPDAPHGLRRPLPPPTALSADGALGASQTELSSGSIPPLSALLAGARRDPELSSPLGAYFEALDLRS